MGNVINVVCTVQAYTYLASDYFNPNFALGYTAIVNGGNCAYSVNFNDPNAQLEVFNTTAGQAVLESFGCVLSSSGCTTNYRIFNSAPFSLITNDFEEYNVTTGALNDVANWTYIAMPPVPSQPSPITLVNNGYAVQVNSSLYSTEYGSAMTGCVLSAGPFNRTTGAQYTGTDLPSTLSSTQSANSLPYTSFAIYGQGQNVMSVVNLTQLNLGPGQVIDLWYVCYNGNGQSWPAVLWNTSTPLGLPMPSVSSSSTAAPRASSSSSAAPSSTMSPAPGTSTGGGVGASSSGGSGLSGGAIAGIVIGSVVGAVLLALILFALCAPGRRNKKSMHEERQEPSNNSATWRRHEGETGTTGNEVEMQA